MTDAVTYSLLAAQALFALGGIAAVVVMFKRRAKERRDKAQRPTSPPATPEPDRPDWHGAPAGRPR